MQTVLNTHELDTVLVFLGLLDLICFSRIRSKEIHDGFHELVYHRKLDPDSLLDFRE